MKQKTKAKPLANGERPEWKMCKVPIALWNAAVKRKQRAGLHSVMEAFRAIARAEHAREDALTKRRNNEQIARATGFVSSAEAHE